jgi:hypothetical protein
VRDLDEDIDLENDEFGPGVDLMAALFAVVVIIAAFLGLDPALNEATVLRTALEQRDERIRQLEEQIATLLDPGQAPPDPNANAVIAALRRDIDALSRALDDERGRAADLARENAGLLAPTVADASEAAIGPLFDGNGSPTPGLLSALARAAAVFRAEQDPGAANVLEFEVFSSLADGRLETDGRDGVLAASAARAAALETALRSAGLAGGCLRFKPAGLAATRLFRQMLADRSQDPARVAQAIRDEMVDTAFMEEYARDVAPSERRVVVRAVRVFGAFGELCDADGLREDLDRLTRLVSQ